MVCLGESGSVIESARDREWRFVENENGFSVEHDEWRVLAALALRSRISHKLYVTEPGLLPGITQDGHAVAFYLRSKVVVRLHRIPCAFRQSLGSYGSRCR